MAKPQKKALGRGLGSLLGDRPSALDPPAANNTQASALPDGAVLLALDPREIRRNPQQPRQYFDEEALQELAESIRRDGVQEPVIVRKKDGHYELVGGERRVRASVMADLDLIPAVCRDVADGDMLKLSIIENVQREDLNAIELGQAYQQLIDAYGWTQEQVAAEVGKNRATVANVLRLLQLPGDVQQLVSEGKLSMGHARAILAIEGAEAQSRAARKVIAEGLSVRQTEKLAAAPKASAPKAPAPKDPNVTHLEDELRRSLGTKVAVKNLDNGRGKIEIEYYNLDDLERILAVLKGRP